MISKMKKNANRIRIMKNLAKIAFLACAVLQSSCNKAHGTHDRHSNKPDSVNPSPRTNSGYPIFNPITNHSSYNPSSSSNQHSEPRNLRKPIRQRSATIEETRQTIDELHRIMDEEEAAHRHLNYHPTVEIRLNEAYQAHQDWSDGERIMIYEAAAFDIEPHMIWRYLPRVMGIYQLQEDGTLEEIKPKSNIFQFQQRMGQHLSQLPYHVRPYYLNSINSRSSEITKNLSNKDQSKFWLYQSYHHVVVFQLLADLNPNAQFIFVQSPGSNSSLNKKDLVNSSFYHNHNISLRSLIYKHKINYMNISEGVDITQYASSSQRRLNHESNYSARFADLMQSLNEWFPELLIFKGIPNNVSSLDSRPER
jgi:hypothetical protein